MVKLLLSRGANINAFDKKDRRAIHWAAYMGKIVIMWDFISNTIATTPLVGAKLMCGLD